MRPPSRIPHPEERHHLGIITDLLMEAATGGAPRITVLGGYIAGVVWMKRTTVLMS